MKFKKLILKDFFRFYGKQEIDCTVSDDKSVLVIIGENGRGKTTILSAFNFVLYGKLLEPLTEESMLNYRKKSEISNNTSIEAYVELIFEEGGVDYILKRYIDFKKDNYGHINKLTRAKGVVYRIDNNGNKNELNLRAFEDKFLIPEDLSGFFFFDGERINRLAKVDGKKEIKKAILNILGISHIDNAKNDILKVKKNLLSESHKYSNGDDYQELVDQIEEINEAVERITNELIKIENDIARAEKGFDDVSNIIRTSDSKNVKELEKQENRLNTLLKDHKRRLIDIEKKIKRHIGNNFKFYLAKDSIKDTEKILEEKKADGILPSNIKETFINDLLKNKKCICGVCLEAGTNEYKAVLDLKSQAGSKELDNAYYKLKALIDKIKKMTKAFYPILDNLTDERDNIKKGIYDTNEELKAISNKLKNSDIETIKNAEELRSEIRSQIAILNQKKGKYQDKIEVYNKERETLEKKLRTLESNNKQIIELQNKLEVINKLQQLNDDFKQMFTDIVRDELDNKIKEVFSSITSKSYRIPILTKEFELKITSQYNQVGIDDSNKKDELLSTGEGQITSLSFIGALVSYARDKKDDDVLSKLSGEEYPIVMDSPFGNLDEIHTKNVASNIGKLSSQVIIVVSQKQWEGHVSENIISQVNKKYRMKDGEIDINGGECTFIEEEVI